MRNKLKNICEFIKIKKKNILGLCAWTLIIALVLIKTYYFFFSRTGVIPRPFSTVYGPMLGTLDMAVLLAASTVIALILADAKSIVYSYLLSIFLSSLIAMAYDAYYIWSMWGYLFQTVPYGWELACYWATMNVFRTMFPFGVSVCLLGAIVGGMLSGI